jgi:hypothetical protein
MGVIDGLEGKMTFKEWTAVIQLAGLVVIGGWLASDFVAGAGDSSVAAVATRLVWAIGAVIVFNIVVTIVMAILVSIARGEEFKDERADERDVLVAAKGSRNAYAVVSLGAAAGLLLLAFGFDPRFGAYALFVAPMLGGAVDAVSRLVYYRIG